MAEVYRRNSTIAAYLPKLSQEDSTFLDSLPESYRLDVPFIKQEMMNWCGPACCQMYLAYLGKSYPSQEELAKRIKCENYMFINHETFEDDLVRVMARFNVVPLTYFPALHVMDYFDNSTEGGDFIYANNEAFEDVDFHIFKASLLKTNTPVLIRIHFTTKDYHMPNDMARKIDNSGHCVLIVGWNKDGFIVNDPWDKEKWGGMRGGKDNDITFHDLGGPNAPVNSTRDFMACFVTPKINYIQPRIVPLSGREFEVSTKIMIPGLQSIHSKMLSLSNVTGILKSDDIEHNEALMSFCSSTINLDETYEIKWKVEAGDKFGSREFMAIIQLSINLPCRKWERNNTKDETLTIEEIMYFRIDIKNTNWFPLYGRI